MRHFDLFSGIGGFALAAAWAGFTTIGFSETDNFCSRVLAKHWPNVPNWGDVCNVSGLDNITLLTGGFPCQPFSSAGKKQGVNDVRHLWPEYIRIIRDFKPRWVVAENVTGLIPIALDAVLNDLESEGYETETFIIPACAVDAPHRRERLWIVANANSVRQSHGLNTSELHAIITNEDRNAKAHENVWASLKPQSWAAFNAADWFGAITDADSITSAQAYKNTTTQRGRHAPARNQLNGENSGDEAVITREENKPPVSGVDARLPHIVDRNKSLGNSIVPQVVYPILRLIATIEEHLQCHE